MMRIIDDASLLALNTFGVAARARRLITVDDCESLPQAIRLLASDRRRLVLGGGSNLLLTGDFDGSVLQLRASGCAILEQTPNEALVEAQAGCAWDDFVNWTLAQGLGGLENLAGIPGSVGASPVQNIGAYGVEMREHFAGLDALSIDHGVTRRFDAAACGFGYRDSVFKQAQTGRWLITRVRFRLSRQPRLRLDYGDIRAALQRADCGAPTPDDVARAVRAIRQRRLPDPAQLGNAGSFFQNPIVSQAEAARLASRHPGMPQWPATDGVKLAAAWLIEQAGWKGARDGDAGMHAAHALVLVNHGQASGAQLLGFAHRVRDAVRERFGVTLVPEPLIL